MGETGEAERMLARVAANWPVLAKRVPGAAQAAPDALRALPIGHRAVASATAGLWRIELGGTAAPATLIVKRIAEGKGQAVRWQATTDPSDPYYWAREAIVYDTRFFGDERTGLRSADCYLVDRRDDAIDIYLEDVGGSAGTSWNIAAYALAAERLGRYQGAAAAEPADAPWLRGPGFFAAYLARREDLCAGAEELVRAPAPYLEHEGLRELAPAVHRLWELRERVLAFCATLPLTHCHNDFWSPNLFAQTDPPQTVAIDLAFAGLGPPGHDAGNMIADAVLDFFVPAHAAEQLRDAVIQGYGRGLSEALSSDVVRAAEHVTLLTAALKFAWLIPATFAVARSPERVASIAQVHGDAVTFFHKRSAALRFVGTLIARSLRFLDTSG